MAAEVAAQATDRKPILALLVGASAPHGVSLGHAGALIDGPETSWAAKVNSLQAAGVAVANSLEDLAERCRSLLR
jgi:succinyl-CoA synthetase alpha subunit